MYPLSNFLTFLDVRIPVENKDLCLCGSAWSAWPRDENIFVLLICDHALMIPAKQDKTNCLKYFGESAEMIYIGVYLGKDLFGNKLCKCVTLWPVSALRNLMVLLVALVKMLCSVVESLS